MILPVYIAAAFLSVVLASASNSDTTSDGSSLWNMIPDCARTCVNNFIDTQYTEAECQTSTNIKCLCRNKTPTGLTLGEAALSCTYALCDDETMKNTNVYRICDSVSGAISETHATITATTFPRKTTTKTQATTTKEDPTSTSSTETAADAPASTTSSEAPKITTFHQTTSTSDPAPETTGSEHPSSTPTKTHTSSTATNTPEPDGNGDHHGVSAGTVIGVSIASGVAGSFIIGVAVFFCCKRWRHQRRNSSEPDSDFFEIGGAMSEPPGFSETSSRRSTPDPGPGPSPFNASGKQPEISEPQRSFQPGSQYPPTIMSFATTHPGDQGVQRKQERIGFAVSSASDWADSPRSQTSQAPLRDTAPSQGAGLYPKPLKWSHRPASGETLFEEEEENQTATMAAAQWPKMTQISGSPSMVPGLPANPRALKDGFPAERFRRAPAVPSKMTHVQYPLGIQPKTRESTQPPPSNGRSTQRASYTSNSSSAQNYSSDCSQETTSNTLLTTPGRPDPLTPNQVPARKPTPGTATLAPPAEIVSRPRIVRGDDIKRVHIRSSPRPRPPSEGSAPWGPDDLWLERSRAHAPPPQASSELPYPSERCPGVILYPSSPKKRPTDVPQRVSPTGRNLTPSKRGADLILRVD